MGRDEKNEKNYVNINSNDDCSRSGAGNRSGGKAAVC